jgi:hypothetical protein
MTRNLLRLASLVFVFATALGLTLPRPASAVSFFCGTGDFFVSCTQTCCGPGVTTTYTSVVGAGSSCTAARSTCGTCAPCPTGQTRCGNTYGACAT